MTADPSSKFKRASVMDRLDVLKGFSEQLRKVAAPTSPFAKVTAAVQPGKLPKVVSKAHMSPQTPAPAAEAAGGMHLSVPPPPTVMPSGR